MQGPGERSPRPRRASPLSGLRCELFRDFAHLEALEGEWERLRLQDPRREVFQRFAWVRASWRTFGATRRLCTPVVFRGAAPIAILPLMLEGGVIRFLTMPGADYNDLLAAPDAGPEALALVLGALDTLREPWRVCRLENLPEHARLLQFADGLPGAFRARLHRRFSAECPTVVLGTERAELLRSITQKKDLKRKEKNLAKRGEVRLRHVAGGGEVLEHLPRFFEQHKLRRALTRERSQFERGEQEAFYRSLVEELPKETLRFSVLELDGRPIAYHFGFEDNGKLIYYKPTFDVDLWDCSPGLILILRLLEYASHAGLAELDFAGGIGDHKSRFANLTRTNFEIMFAPRTPAGRVRLVLARARERLKSHPRVFAVAKDASERVATRGILPLAGDLLRDLWGAVHRREEVLFFAAASSPVDVECVYELEAGALSAVARIASRRDDLGENDLRRVREGTRAGDRIYVAQRGGEVAYLFLLGTRAELSDSGGRRDGPRVALAEPVTMIERVWTARARRGEAIPASLLARLAQLAPVGHREVWFTCPSTDTASARSIAAAGFLLRHRIGREHWFRRRPRTWSVGMQGTEQGGPREPASSE